jgi:hypothetical protein
VDRAVMVPILSPPGQVHGLVGTAGSDPASWHCHAAPRPVLRKHATKGDSTSWLSMGSHGGPNGAGPTLMVRGVLGPGVEVALQPAVHIQQSGGEASTTVPPDDKVVVECSHGPPGQEQYSLMGAISGP